jgi:hypothetical protein
MTGSRYVKVQALDHYLEVLKRKPCAARRDATWPKPQRQGVYPVAPTVRDAVLKTRGDAKGTRALIEVLLAHRGLPAASMITAMDVAVTSGVCQG